MSIARCRWIGLLGGTLAITGALAGQAALDGDLFEFLGSVDTEGDGWGEYLEGTDVSRVAPPSAATPPATQPQQPPPKRQVHAP